MVTFISSPRKFGASAQSGLSFFGARRDILSGRVQGQDRRERGGGLVLLCGEAAVEVARVACGVDGDKFLGRERPVKLKIAVMIGGLLFGLVCADRAFAGWEAGAKLGFDSNLSRSINGGKSDVYLFVYSGLGREPSGESRVDWTAMATVEGAAFARLQELSYAAVTLVAGLTYLPHHAWSITLSPFFQAKGVQDSDQSALAFGGKVDMRQQLRENLYLGEYYVYTDSWAEVSTYSFQEHGIGGFFGINWTPKMFSEIGYEFSRGDSFRTLNESSDGTQQEGRQRGKGKHSTFSTTFGEKVIRERVDNHAIGVNLGIDWTRQLFSLVSYIFTATEGHSGSSVTHSGFVGAGFRF
jgi:hypothetical protein